MSRDRSRSAAAEAARAKAAAGDCAAALDLFDEALRHSIDPTLYRDRGECHDKLGHVFPALDDFRAYILHAPDAADVDKYRARVEELVKLASQDMAPGLGRGGDFDSEMRGGMTDGSTPANMPSSKVPEEPKSTEREEPGKTMSTIESEEARDREAHGSPMRLGTGFVLGAFYDPRYVFNPWDFQFGQGVGARLGWSFSSASTLFLELGYINQSGTSFAAGSVKDGFMSLLGYEFRVPLDGWATNQIVLAFGAGFEDVTDETLGQQYGSIVGRAAGGLPSRVWRRLRARDLRRRRRDGNAPLRPATGRLASGAWAGSSEAWSRSPWGSERPASNPPDDVRSERHRGETDGPRGDAHAERDGVAVVDQSRHCVSSADQSWCGSRHPCPREWQPHASSIPGCTWRARTC